MKYEKCDFLQLSCQLHTTLVVKFISNVNWSSICRTLWEFCVKGKLPDANLLRRLSEISEDFEQFWVSYIEKFLFGVISSLKMIVKK